MTETRRGIIFWIVLILVIALEIIAEFYIKKYTIEPRKTFLILSIVMYILIPVFLIQLFKKDKNLAVANTLWQVSNLVIVAFIGVLVFKDELNHVQWVGFGLAIISAILLVI